MDSTRRSQRRPARVPVVALLLAAGLAASAPAQEEDEAPDGPSVIDQARAAFEQMMVPRHRFRDSPGVKALFRGVVAEARQSTVFVRHKGRTLCLGGIVGPEGWVLTKASRLEEPLLVLLPDQRELPARVVGVDRDFDLAVLKIDASGLKSLDLKEDAAATAGDWVATPGQSHDPVLVGVVSVGPRKIAHRPGTLGVRLAAVPDREGALIVQIFADSGAEQAGLRVNDVVTRANGRSIKRWEDLKEEIIRHSPRDEIRLGVRRDGQEITINAVLTGHVPEMFGPESRSDYQNSLGGRLSQRRFGFPEAIQHDTVLKPTECGGPLVDLDGRVVGFNIARAGRTESYAIPTSAVLPLMYRLMSGNQPPGDE